MRKVSKASNKTKKTFLTLNSFYNAILLLSPKLMEMMTKKHYPKK